MEEFIKAFLAASGYADSTRESYSYALTRLFDWLNDQGLTIDDLTVDAYDRFLNGHNWSNNMRRLYASAIRKFIQWLRGNREHPIFEIKLPKDDSLPGRALDAQALRDLLASFDTSTPLGWRDLAMAALLAETGLRASEICRLEMARLDMRNRRFTVLAKRQKPREGIFSEDTARFLEIWLGERKKVALRGTKTVFVSIGGKRPGTSMTSDGLRTLYRKFGEQAGIGRLSPHDMRRTMAMLLTEADAPSRLVQKLGGWDDIRMVERYTRTLKPQQIDRYSPVKTALETLNIPSPSNNPSNKPKDP
jgi:site-specific recombinase XerD